MVIGLYFASIAILLVMTIKRPPIALGALLCMFAIEQWAQSTNSFFTKYHELTNYIFAALIILAISIRGVRGHLNIRNYPKVGWLILALFLYAYISVLWTPRPEISYGIWSTMWPYVIVFVLLAPFVASSIDDIHNALMTTLILGSAVVLLLLLTSNWEYRWVVLKTDSGPAIGNPLAIAQIAGYVLILSTLLNFKEGSIWSLIKWGLVAASLALAVKTGSRGQFFSMLLTVLVFLPFSKRIKNFRGFVVLVVGVAVLSILGMWAQNTFYGDDVRWDPNKMGEDWQGRFAMAKELLAHWYSSPITLFFGLGNSASFDPKIIGFYPHIVSLEILAEEGILGFVLFIGIVMLTQKNIRIAYSYCKEDPRSRGILMSLSALFFFELFLSFKQGSLLGNVYLFVFATIIGRFLLDLKSKEALKDAGAIKYKPIVTKLGYRRRFRS